MKLGLVDLDTSHPLAWLPIERALGHEVVGVWDGGSVHPRGYAERFAADNGIPAVYPSLDEMVAEVDCAVVHSCNWDLHVERARPFVAAGKAVLVDKPIAGKHSDLDQLLAWQAEGARIYGGSALRFARETAAWLEQPVTERGSPLTVLAGCGTDHYNYGIHAYSLALSVLGPGVAAVRCLGDGRQRLVELTYEDGRSGLVVTGPLGLSLPFYCTVITELSVTHYEAERGDLYRPLLEVSLPYLAGEARPPVPLNEVIEAERCALAAEQSRLQGSRVVGLEKMAGDIGYDGREFAAAYRRERYPEGPDPR